MTVYTTMDSPLGELLLVGEPSRTAPGGVALTSLSMPGQRGAVAIRDEWVSDAAAFAAIGAQLRAYFAGESTPFDIEFTSAGSEFQQRVWRALDAIPYGETVSYGELTARIGAPRERVRAVAGAIGANPLLVVRPCHRVIGANGALTGYAGGLERKQKLLELENVLLAV
ncbi:methylated-DNA--[protein]-cysteine S-methyltransferase [Nocardia sp. 2]|uniref:Methylated-DNA--protein-cysteine methyltransferase n=1 Tax=Nocardia acididurans TaxID=2802282 RepID=A0ABS1M1Q5_9NOCA|nr:methylated-DNA--[protein]-cysteine S-methyltransferase [Nocardia acididurans]MBL1074593.1 methylated-DNA--[protein]-cysteine S-methyltransferase [Nocardia acididurans]